MNKRKKKNNGSSSTTQTTKKTKTKGHASFEETYKIGKGHILYDEQKKIFIGHIVHKEGGYAPAKGIMVNFNGNIDIQWYKRGGPYKKAFILENGSLFLGEPTMKKGSEGKGLKILRNNSIINGVWKNSKLIDRPARVYNNNGCVYIGTVLQGKKHGKGTYTSASGEIYDGQWENDKRHGKGKQIYAIGDVYNGQWKNNKRHGKGTMMYDGGSVFNGEWKDGNRHGDGRMIYSNGDVYIGEWKHELKGFNRHGKGRLYSFANGKVYDGQWENDKCLNTQV